MNSHRVLVVFGCTKIRIFYEVTIKILQNKGIVMKSYSQPATAKLAIFRKKDNFRGFKIEFFSRSTVNLILDFANELIGQG